MSSWHGFGGPTRKHLRISQSRLVEVGGGYPSKGTIHVKVVDLDKNPPLNPVADDRNDSYVKPASLPSNSHMKEARWSIWRPWWHEYWVYHDGGEDEDGYWEDEGWWEFDQDWYQASLSGGMDIFPDEKNPTATGDIIKSGYGINQEILADVSTTQSSAVTGAQNAVTYFPEFHYQTYWRLLERLSGDYHARFEFKENEYSTFGDVPTLHHYGCQMEHIRRIPGFWTAGRPKACYPLTFQTMWIYRGIYGWIGILDQLVPRCRATSTLNRYINFTLFL